MNLKTPRRRADDPQQPDRMRKGMYILPSIFTAGNIAAGYYAISQAIQGSASAAFHFDNAAIAIGFAVLFDGIDGRVARMTNTTSDFGRELDSLADFITFGIAPGVLAFVWGERYVVFSAAENVAQTHLSRAGYLVAFFYLLCCAVRLARFNVQTNPVPKNPGRPDRKYFVGLPIPAGAAIIAAIVFASDSAPIQWWPLSALWLAFLGLLGFLMVSTWRYPSFKQINLLGP